MTGKTTSQGQTTYSYDLENRLTGVALPDGSVNSFVYDGDGKRVRKTTPAGTTNYLYDGMSVIEETDQSGALIASYTTDPTALVGQIISRKDDAGQLSYYSYDGIGSTRNVTDQTQAQMAGYSYEAFGNVLSETGTPANTYKFSAKELDQTGLYYFGARYYDPEIGRFVTRDPVAGDLEDPQSLNPYTYCENDPVNTVDPDGALVAPATAGMVLLVVYSTIVIVDVAYIAYSVYYESKKSEKQKRKKPLPKQPEFRAVEPPRYEKCVVEKGDPIYGWLKLYRQGLYEARGRPIYYTPGETER